MRAASLFGSNLFQIYYLQHDQLRTFITQQDGLQQRAIVSLDVRYFTKVTHKCLIKKQPILRRLYLSCLFVSGLIII